MRPPRRPDRRSDTRDRRPIPPRDAKPAGEGGEAKPPRAKPDRPMNARAVRAARFKAEHAPEGGERQPRITKSAAKPAGRSAASKAPRVKPERLASTTEGRKVTGAERAANARARRTSQLRTGDNAAPPPAERQPRDTRTSPEGRPAKPSRAKSERPAFLTEEAPARRPARPKASDGTAAPRAERPKRDAIPPAESRPARPSRAKPDRPAPIAGRDAESPRPAGRAPTKAVVRATTPRPPEPRPAASARREPQRIAKLLARAGIASRREIERMIAEGRVAQDGVALDTPATIVTSLHGITVDGVAVNAPTPARLFLFNKPTGFLTAERDPRGRPTIYDRLPRDLPRVMPVGRLDLNTEGLLLLTTDGELKRSLELPATGIPRIYRARAYGEVTQQQLEELIEGVEIDGMRYGQIDANLERRTGRNVWIEMKITEGKNREVRRVLEYLGLQVSRLIRVAYGPFVLADLAPGGVVEVRQHDLVAFRQTLK